jgi:hypothetical protein
MKHDRTTLFYNISYSHLKISYDDIIPTDETASLNNLIIIIYNYIYNFYTQKEYIPQVIHTKNCTFKIIQW